MAKQPSIEQDGTIVEALGNAMFSCRIRKWARNYCSYIRKDENALHQNLTW